MQITFLMNFAHLILGFIAVVVIHAIHLVFVVVTLFASDFRPLSVIVVIIMKIYASCDQGFLIDCCANDE